MIYAVLRRYSSIIKKNLMNWSPKLGLQNKKVVKLNNFIYRDRFIIIDNKILYHSGASSKDLGKKCLALTKIEDEEILKGLLKHMKKIN